MSSPILRIQGPWGPPNSISAALEESPLVIEAFRGGPPAQLLQEIALAGAIEQQLYESGRQLRFLPAPPGKRTRIETHDHEGHARTLTVAEAVEIAAGKPLG